MNLDVVGPSGRALGELRLSAWASVVQLSDAQLEIADGAGNLLGTISFRPGCRQVDLETLRRLGALCVEVVPK